MSVIAVGPALDLDGPLPVAPPHSLLSIPGVIRDDGDRWLNGVNIDSYPCDTPTLWDPCSTGTYRTKDESVEMPRPRFDSFAVIQALSCSSLGMGDPDAFARKAENVLDATQSFGIEEALSQGVTGSTNPFLGDVNVTVLGGGAVTPDVGLAWLENAIGETGRMGMIHASPAVVSAWGDDLDLVDGALRTVNGTPVASGGGYIAAEANGSAPAGGQSYAFASGPVEVRLASVSIQPIYETLDRSDNTVVYRAERYALAEWDTCLQVAVLIDWTP